MFLRSGGSLLLARSGVEHITPLKGHLRVTRPLEERKLEHYGDSWEEDVENILPRNGRNCADPDPPAAMQSPASPLGFQPVVSLLREECHCARIAIELSPARLNAHQ